MKVKRIDMESGTVRIDWGWATYNHAIPEEILAQPDMHPEEAKRHLRALEPERPTPAPEVPSALSSLLEEDENDDSERVVVPEDTTYGEDVTSSADYGSDVNEIETVKEI